MIPSSQHNDSTRLEAAANYFYDHLKIINGEPTVARSSGYCLFISPLIYEDGSEHLLATLSAGLVPGPDVQEQPYELVDEMGQVLTQGVTNNNGQFHMERYLGHTVRVRFHVSAAKPTLPVDHNERSRRMGRRLLLPATGLAAGTEKSDDDRLLTVDSGLLQLRCPIENAEGVFFNRGLALVKYQSKSGQTIYRLMVVSRNDKDHYWEGTLRLYYLEENATLESDLANEVEVFDLNKLTLSEWQADLLPEIRRLRASDLGRVSSVIRSLDQLEAKFVN